MHDLLEDEAVILRDSAQVVPVATVWDVEGVEVRGHFPVDTFPEDIYRLGLFLVPGVTEPFEEQ